MRLITSTWTFAGLLLAASLPLAPALAADPQPTVPTDRASLFSGASLETIWRDLETRQVLNKRVVEGGHYSINVRIVRPTDPPLVHKASADVWVVTAGHATAVTGGELVAPVKRPDSDDTSGTEIRGGKEQPLGPGDVLFVPAGIPHGFKNLQNYRALLIRFNTP